MNICNTLLVVQVDVNNVAINGRLASISVRQSPTGNSFAISSKMFNTIFFPVCITATRNSLMRLYRNIFWVCTALIISTNTFKLKNHIENNYHLFCLITFKLSYIIQTLNSMKKYLRLVGKISQEDTSTQCCHALNSF